ncbi:tRNA (adenosine(37)-N6)-dimethylallyltransferase MiaA [Glacieibacterium frigidum]|uniref:tRNA dimethylallyltransferase n=1 Tax=Glacieibacterium frigidum TaxID=2593303 RepID=A0A552UH65_9SPHN|nr:tRNA (adenosine(37)-N6)-dimethylallyltransferase MiaA [Glacieibacterium frigidum]TRW17566.1 tRNA (adenosine(37)-N6)-dimethylallyltransferase MiaA [Glacieibacterium frigidum]
MSVTSIEPPAADRPRVAIIAGPTACGKSALALEVAEALNGTIINADASQVYADLRILTARPSDADMARVPHLLYGVLDGSEAGSAASWAALARAAVADTLAVGRLPILVGGSGLYLRTLLDGIAAVPPIDAEVREAVRALDGVAAHAALTDEDPAAAARLNPADRQRVQRALEVVRGTGRSLAAWQATATNGLAATADICGMIVDLPRDELRARCDARFDAMLAAGGLEEVRTLAARRLDPGLPVMTAIGVPPLLAHLAGTLSLADAADDARHATRRYAKRQQTWFRNQTPGWWRVDSADAARATIRTVHIG